MADEHQRARLGRQGLRHWTDVVVGSQTRLHANALAGIKFFREDRRRLLGAQFTAVTNLVDFYASLRRADRDLLLRRSGRAGRSSSLFRLGGDAISQLVVKKPNKNNDTILRLPEG
jgi:hypothetical protein